MSFLRATRKVTERIHIDCPLANALEFIQNPEAMIDINPLVIHRHQDPNDPNLWIIKDSLKVMGVMKYEIEYTARFARVVNGTDVEVHAPAGTTLLSHWRVTEVEGRVQIEEEVNISASVRKPSADNYPFARLAG
ncbi:hypothetical protein K474DRAFT_1770705 [Panus rudis PR-1116 ss-1]|nr:hypothetical protein K474DRAFT_1770705 [Panus rudis PR-1116 ss-1]